MSGKIETSGNSAELKETCDGPGVKQALLAMALLFATLLLFHGPLVLGLEVLCGGDLVNEQFPIREAQLRHGWFAGWMPETFSGRPLLDSIQTGAFYPPNWLYMIGIAPERIFTWLTLAHIGFGGLGLWLFLRRRFPFFIAMLGAILWTAGGYQALRLTNGVVIFNLALGWVPWMWWAAEWQAMDRGRRMAGVGFLALFGAMQLLAGAPQVSQITWVGLGIWTLGRLLYNEAVPRKQIITGFILAGIVALLISSPMLFSVLRHHAESYQREQVDPMAYLSDGSLEWRVALSWLMPTFFAPGNSEVLYWGSAIGYLETNIFIGLLPVLLALLGVVAFIAVGFQRTGELSIYTHTDRRWMLSGIALALFGFLVALGSHGFLFEFLVRFVPSFGLFRVPARWLLWLVLPVIVAVCYGLEQLRVASSGKLVLSLWLGLVAAGLLFFGVLLWMDTDLLLNLGFGSRFRSPTLDGDAEILVYAKRAIQQALVVVAVGGLFGALAIAKSSLAPKVLIVVALLFLAELRLYWGPFTEVLPGELPSPMVETETPYHRIKTEHFRSFFYPETELVKELKERSKGRIGNADTLLFYMFDQDFRELLNERPAVQGLEVQRGYQQQILATYAADNMRSSHDIPGGARLAPYLMQMYPADRRFHDAYNIDVVLVHPYQGLMEEFLKVGFVMEKPPVGDGVAILRNPTVRGWAWLSSNPSFLDAIPDAGLGSVMVNTRTANLWEGKATVKSDGWLHLSSPEYSGWRLYATHSDGTVMEGANSRSVRLTKAGEWTFTREFYSIGLKPGNLLLALIGTILAVGMIAMPLRGSREDIG